MITKLEGFQKRQKDIGWGYALAHVMPFVWLYYAITRRTITPLLKSNLVLGLVGFN